MCPRCGQIFKMGARNILLCSILLCAFYLLPHTCAAQPEDLNSIERLTAKGDNTAALKSCRALAEHGSADAQLQLALMYKEGRGTAVDLKQYALWLTRAANQGVPKAEWMLGECYEEGLGLPENRLQCISCYEKASNHGSSDAAFALSALYFNDKQFRSNKTIRSQALAWLKKAAELGNLEAQADTGDLCWVVAVSTPITKRR